MVELAVDGLLDVADSVAASSHFPAALTEALLETLERGDERGLLAERHYLDWVSKKHSTLERPLKRRMFEYSNMCVFTYSWINFLCKFRVGASK